MISFADDEFDTKEYILLQKLLVADEQDKEQGLGEVHITYNDEVRSNYGGILNVTLYKNCIEIELDNNTAKELQLENMIQVSFSQKDPNLAAVKKHLEKMFHNCKGVFKSKL